MVSKVDQDSMREANRKLMVQALFNAQQTSRVEIANTINLHKSTITAIYRDIEDAGLIEDLGEGPSSNVGGRRPRLIRFNHNYGYVVTFDLGHSHLRYMAAKLTGEIITRGEITITNMSLPEIERAALAYIAQLGQLNTDHGLLGVGIAIHGVVENNHIRYTPYLKEIVQYDLANEWQSKLNVPVFLENEANLAAIYLRDYQDYAGDMVLNNFITINIHDGIGAGIIQNGELFIGVHGEAGEIGRTVMLKNNWMHEGFVNPVHLEDLFSEDALLARTIKLANLPSLSREEFCQLIDNQDPIAVAVLDEWLQTMASVFYNIVQQTAPEAVFVHSRILGKRPVFFNVLRSFYDSITPKTEIPLIFASQAVDRATLAGGVAMVTRKLLDLEGFRLVFQTDIKNESNS
ncbi:ROK family protein [Weissella diestrammenae]|uniref:ROK family protein n=1 Tax=Weissella diestrammenae TaxID=1162633 RepID=A0A7G9T753_9LACO|nr:ROK family protein [Weissella diestrammenae]MCM0582471.1 ROK family protein [Weissella diestrammenae]QNN75928.1 ROK family protein [Weissella diestrammenae]